MQIPEERKRFSNGDLMRLIVPILIEQFLTLLVGLADTLMISYAGEAAVSGVTLVNQVATLFIMIFGALASGGTVVASQYIGKGDKENTVFAASQLVMISAVISAVLMALTILFHAGIIDGLFGRAEQDVTDAAKVYLLLTAYSFPFLAIYNSCAGLFRSMNHTKEVMYISMAMNLINVVGNAIGIFGLHAGVAGVAVPTLISRIFAAVVLYVMLSGKAYPIYIELRQILRFDGEMCGRIFGIAIPSTIENGLFQLSKIVLSSLIAGFGTVQIAANGVAQSFWSMAALCGTSMGYAFVTVIGQCMGAQDTEAADYYNKKLLRVTYLFVFTWNMVTLAISPLALMLFSLSAETKHLVMIMIVLHNVFNFMFCPCAFPLSNGLRAAGDVKYTMYASIFSTVVVRVFFSFLLGLWLNLGVIGITLAMNIDWFVKAVLIVIRYRSGVWKKFRVV